MKKVLHYPDTIKYSCNQILTVIWMVAVMALLLLIKKYLQYMQLSTDYESSEYRFSPPFSDRLTTLENIPSIPLRHSLTSQQTETKIRSKVNDTAEDKGLN